MQKDAGALPAGMRDISARLTRARAQASALPGPPDGLPQSLEDAYRLQAHSIAAWDDAVAGWKVGGVPAAYLGRFDASRLAGPIFARSVRRAGDDGVTAMPVFDGGFAAIEPEYIYMLGASRDEDRMFIGAEIASSPIPAINDHGPVAVISDFGNNHGLLVGPEISDWRTRDGAARVRTVLDGECVGEAELDDFRRDALDALAFLLDLNARRGYANAPGTFVSTGAITGVHEAPIGTQGVLDFGAFGTVALELTAASPR